MSEHAKARRAAVQFQRDSAAPGWFEIDYQEGFLKGFDKGWQAALDMVNGTIVNPSVTEWSSSERESDG